MPPDISLPKAIPAPPLVSPVMLLMLILELGWANEMPYSSHPLLMAITSSPFLT
jgi:hypothetical protein